MKSLYQFILVWLSVLAYAQPSGACAEGTTRIDASGHLYGCVVDKWIKISEDFDVPTATYSTTAASTGLAPSNNNVMLRVGDKNYQLPNRGFVPILPSAIADAPSHLLGKVFYSKANKHFYQGVDNGKWHQIDNESNAGFSSTKTGREGRNFTKNNCAANYTGSSVYVTRTASGTATSTISQADADSKAQALANSNALALVYAEGQAEANSRGTCTYNPPVTTYSATKTGTVGRNFTKNNCGTNYTGSSVYVTRTASGTATSTISQADADSKAQALANSNALALVYAEGQAEANSRGTCTYNPPARTIKHWSCTTSVNVNVSWQGCYQWNESHDDTLPDCLGNKASSSAYTSPTDRTSTSSRSYQAGACMYDIDSGCTSQTVTETTTTKCTPVYN